MIKKIRRDRICILHWNDEWKESMDILLKLYHEARNDFPRLLAEQATIGYYGGIWVKPFLCIKFKVPEDVKIPDSYQ